MTFAVTQRILVIEDDTEMGALLERGLTGEGEEVRLVGTGVDALIVLAHDDFAAAAIDVLLPRISGLELCRHDYDYPAGCLPATRSKTASSASTPAPTTTSPSRSHSLNSARGSMGARWL